MTITRHILIRNLASLWELQPSLSFYQLIQLVTGEKMRDEATADTQVVVDIQHWIDKLSGDEI